MRGRSGIESEVHQLALRPVVPGGHHSPRPFISPAFADNRANNSFNFATFPTVPEVGCTAPPNVANGVHTPFLPLLPLLEGATGGGAAVPPPPAANNLLLAHPGPAGAANNLAASRQNQQHVANAVMAGVDGVIYIDEVEAESIRRPRKRDNIEALDGINNSMLQATRMISQAIGRAHQPPTPVATAAVPLPNADARTLLPGGDGDVIASLYARLVPHKMPKLIYNN